MARVLVVVATLSNQQLLLRTLISKRQLNGSRLTLSYIFPPKSLEDGRFLRVIFIGQGLKPTILTTFVKDILLKEAVKCVMTDPIH